MRSLSIKEVQSVNGGWALVSVKVDATTGAVKVLAPFTKVNVNKSFVKVLAPFTKVFVKTAPADCGCTA